MEDRLIELLQLICPVVIRQGSLTDNDDYPDTFFTFWNNDETEHSAYNNDTLNVAFNYDVNCYSSDPNTAYNLLSDARKLLKDNGFKPLSRGYDIGSDESTHTGRGMNVVILDTVDDSFPELDDIYSALNELLTLQNQCISGGVKS